MKAWPQLSMPKKVMHGQTDKVSYIVIDKIRKIKLESHNIFFMNQRKSK